MKKLNKLSLSLVVGSLLFAQSYALPSGSKFTHGTSGSISVSGGFNIASNETVNFRQGKTNQNYLILKALIIDGTLNSGSNNIFLINPNGIVVGKGGKKLFCLLHQ